MKLPEHPRIRPLIVKAVLASQRARAASASAEATASEAGKPLVGNAAGGGVEAERERVAGAVVATPDQSVRTCLALMEANRLDCIAVVDAGETLGLLRLSELQKALITHYESIFTAIELDQRILFLQGTYSC